MILLSLQGNPYDMGFRHGQELKLLIQCAIRAKCRLYDKNDIVDESVYRKIEDGMESEFPDLMDELRGIADGSESSLNDILFYNFSPESGGCSNLVFLCKDGPMLGHINDAWNGAILDGVCAFRLRRSKNREILYMGSPGSIRIAAGVSSEGLAVSFSSARSGGFKNPKSFLHTGILRRALMEQCRNSEEAKVFLSKNSCTWAGENIIVLDKNSDAFVAEKLATTMELHYPKNGALYCTNRFRTKKIKILTEQDAYEEKHMERIKRLIHREEYFERLINENAGKLSLNLMKQALRCTDEGIEICNKSSNWASILFPGNYEMFVADRFPCNNPFEKIVIDSG